MIDDFFGNPYSSQKNEIVFSQEVEVTAQGKEMVVKKPGESLEIIDTPMFVEAPGYVGMIVIPTNVENAKVQVKLKPAEKWTTKGAKKRNAQAANAVVSEIIEKVADVQRLLLENRGEDALAEVNNLVNKYPQVTYLNFIRSSCLVVVGKRELALEVLQAALQDYPKNPAGLQLYRSLTGEEFAH